MRIAFIVAALSVSLAFGLTTGIAAHAGTKNKEPQRVQTAPSMRSAPANRFSPAFNNGSQNVAPRRFAPQGSANGTFIRPTRTTVPRYGVHEVGPTRMDAGREVGRGRAIAGVSAGALHRVQSGRSYTYRGRSFAAFHAARYRWPYGYAYHRYVVGYRLPHRFWMHDYYVTDYALYDLDPPPPNFAWLRYGPDLVEIDTTTGAIAQIIYGFFDDAAEAPSPASDTYVSPAQAQFDAGRALWQAGNCAAAEAQLSQGLAVDPYDPAANYYYGDCLDKDRNFGGAVGALRLAAEFGDGTPEGQAAADEVRQLADVTSPAQGNDDGCAIPVAPPIPDGASASPADMQIASDRVAVYQRYSDRFASCVQGLIDGFQSQGGIPPVLLRKFQGPVMRNQQERQAVSDQLAAAQAAYAAQPH